MPKITTEERLRWILPRETFIHIKGEIIQFRKETKACAKVLSWKLAQEKGIHLQRCLLNSKSPSNYYIKGIWVFLEINEPANVCF